MAEEPLNRKPFMEHFDELLARLRKSFVFLILGCLAGYSMGDFFIGIMKYPIQNIPFLPEGVIAPRIIVTAPFEKFWVYLRLAMIGGFFMAFPMIAYEVSQFVGPGLKEHEKKRVVYLSVSIYITMLLGLFVGYKWVLPLILSAIVRFGNDVDIVNTWSLSVYVNSSLGVLLVTALLIQLPVLMTHFSSWGWVRCATWAKSRKHALVVNSIVSGILSPPDVQSMIAMMIPVQLLYECGIVCARVAEWLKNDQANSQK